MEQRVSLITLAAEDVEKSAAFYEALGWKRAEAPDGVIAFDLISQTIGLYDKASLAKDMGMDPSEVGGFSGITLSYNVREKDEVAKVYADALAAGGRGIKEPYDIFWGGHIAYFADLDGHVWEVAHNPFSPLGKDGAFQWNGVA